MRGREREGKGRERETERARLRGCRKKDLLSTQLNFLLCIYMYSIGCMVCVYYIAAYILVESLSCVVARTGM